MELSQIRYFIMAAQEQTLTKAAQRLHITQPALSKSISKLENELGVRLFDRAGKKIALNERGREFYEYALKSVQELDNAVSATKNNAADPALHVGLFHHSERFMECLCLFRKENPSVAFQLEHLEIGSHSVDTDRYDMILYPRSPLLQKYKGDVAYSDPYFLAVHKSSPLAGRAAVRLPDLAGQTFVVIRYGDKLPELPFHPYDEKEQGGTAEIFTNSHEIQKWLVSNNCGVGFVAQGAAGVYASDENIALVPVAGAGFSCEVLIGFKREKHLSADGRCFAAYVREYFGIEQAGSLH